VNVTRYGASGVLFGDTCGVTRPVGFHNGITQPPANGKATGVGANAETLSGLGESARKNSDAPQGGAVLECSPEGWATGERSETGEPPGRRSEATSGRGSVTQRCVARTVIEWVWHSELAPPLRLLVA